MTLSAVTLVPGSVSSSGCCSLPVVTSHPQHKALFFHLEQIHGAPGPSCRTFTLKGLDEVEGILLMQHPWKLLRGLRLCWEVSRALSLIPCHWKKGRNAKASP